MTRQEKPVEHKPRPQPERLVTATELASILNVSVAAVVKLRRAGSIPFIPLGPKTFRFSVSKVLERLT